MLLSMTGFGKAEGEYQNKTIKADIKSLNGKTSDIRVKAPNNYRSKEIFIRNAAMEKALRGKLDINIIVSSEDEGEYGLNLNLFKKYHRELISLQSELDYESNDLFSAILRIPNVVNMEEKEIDEEEWNAVCETMDRAFNELNDFRRREGKAMEKDLTENIQIIQDRLIAIHPFENNRIEKLKTRLQKNLQEFLGSDKVDHNRFEQEVVFYIEKLDINEEKVRLSQHCKYFLEVVHSKEISVGKKLTFISQEIGREINTLGSKAQDSDIQQLVVQMKEALEQIKEQLANVV
jgi:uncharacterized protein (TIGR00255 family)